MRGLAWNKRKTQGSPISPLLHGNIHGCVIISAICLNASKAPDIVPVGQKKKGREIGTLYGIERVPEAIWERGHIMIYLHGLFELYEVSLAKASEWSCPQLHPLTRVLRHKAACLLLSTLRD